MPAEIPPNQETMENAHIVEQKGHTKYGKPRKRKTRLSCVFRKETSPNTHSENGGTFAKQMKDGNSFLA